MMEIISTWGSWLLANYQAIITALVGAISAIVALFLIIPGDQPEAFLQKVVDFLAKFSKK